MLFLKVTLHMICPFLGNEMVPFLYICLYNFHISSYYMSLQYRTSCIWEWFCLPAYWCLVILTGWCLVVLVTSTKILSFIYTNLCTLCSLIMYPKLNIYYKQTTGNSLNLMSTQRWLWQSSDMKLEFVGAMYNTINSRCVTVYKIKVKLSQ
jgi:hypothetical protein